MSQDAAIAAPTNEPAAEPAAEWAPPTSQAEFDRIIGERLSRQKAQFAGFDEFKAKAAKLDEIEQANQTEIERVTSQARQAEERAATAARELLRYKVAAEKGVPADLLSGDDEESIAAHADQLLAFRGAVANEPPSVPAFDNGPRATPAAGSDMNSLIRGQLRR